MLTLSPSKHGSNGGNERNGESTQKGRPHYMHVANPFHNAQPPDSLRPISRARYSKEQLVDVFQSTVINPPENALLRQFDIFTDQLLKPLVLSQSSAEEQMACLLLSNGTWTPSGIPPGTQGPPGRSAMQMNAANEGGSFRPPGPRGRGLAMAQRRYPPRPLESDRVDNWRQRPGPPAQATNAASATQQSAATQQASATDTTHSGSLWQSRQAESRLASNWLASSQQSAPVHQPDSIPKDVNIGRHNVAMSPREPSAATQPLTENKSEGLSLQLHSADKKGQVMTGFDAALSEPTKLFNEGLSPVWAPNDTKTESPLNEHPKSSTSLPAVNPTSTSSLEMGVSAMPKVVDGESLWNTLSQEPHQKAYNAYTSESSNFGAVAGQQNNSSVPVSSTALSKKVSPISSDPAVLMAKRLSPIVSTVPTVASSPDPEPEVESEQEQQAWFYVDPSGTLQGPFSGQQMEEWDNEGYFPDDLRLRPAVCALSTSPTDERGFITLAKLRSTAAGGRSPFLSCNLSPRHLTKDAQQQQQQERKKQQVAESCESTLSSSSASGVQVPMHIVERLQASAPDVNRQGWDNNLSLDVAELPAVQLQPQQQQVPAKAYQRQPPASVQPTKQNVPQETTAVTKLGVALTSDPVEQDEEIGWGDEPTFNSEDDHDVVASKSRQSGAISKQQQAQADKKRRRKKLNKTEKEPPLDPLLNAEPAEVRRARLAAEQLRIAEENARKLDGKDAIATVLEKQRIERDKERELERKMLSKPAPSNRPPSTGPSLPSTAKWGVSQPKQHSQPSWTTKAGSSSKPASLLEIQRQEEMAEASERLQEEQRRTLAAAITASTQPTSSSSSAWPMSGNVGNSGGSTKGAWSTAVDPTPPPYVNPSTNRYLGKQTGGFWDDGDDDDLRQPQLKQQQQKQQAAPKLSNILGSSSASTAKSSKQQKDSKPSLSPELSYLASWVVSELSRRYASATSLSPDIVPAFARLLGTIDEMSGADELIQRASPYFYRPEDVKAFIADFIAARTRLQQNPSLSGNTRQNERNSSQKQTHHQQPLQHQAPNSRGGGGGGAAQEFSVKTKGKKKPIPVNPSSLFKLVGPPPPVPQPDE